MATTTVTSGQSISSQTFTGGADLTVSAGGTSTNDLVGAPGVETVYGSSFDDTVSGVAEAGTGPSASYGQALFIAEPGAVVMDVSVLNGAVIVVSSGSFVSGIHLLNGDELAIDGGATAHAATVSGGFSDVAGTLDGFTLSNGSMTVDNFGLVSSGTVGFGGTVDLEGGVEVFSGIGVASAVTVLAGGYLDISAAVAVGTVLSGGRATVNGQAAGEYTFGYSGQALATTIFASGVLVVGSFATVSGTVIGSGGLERLEPGARAQNDVISGGTLELLFGDGGFPYYDTLTATEGGAVTFAGTGGTLLDDGTGKAPLGQTGAQASVISGFNSTDRIVLAGVTADPNATLTVSGNAATVSAGGRSYTLDIVGASTLNLTLGIGTGTGNIDIGSGIVAVACYCAGTAITTADGERPVETIAPGDLVITADGRAEPVVWVGQRSYAGRFLRRQPHLLPVRIRAGALGRRLPRRDLLVSPNHALLLDGMLVPAATLVGAPGIIVDHGCERVDYHHIELARHDVILAEGAPAETFLDDDSRGIFQASGGTPGDAANFCAPRLVDGEQLETIRRRLAA